MPRTVDHAARTLRRDEFIDAAQRLMQTKGYEQMSVQELLSDLGASKGAFYHYFDSKQALLQAMVDRMGDVVTANLAAIVETPGLAPVARLERFFSETATWKTERKDLFVALLRVWYSDDNAIVRDKLRRDSMRRLAPLLARIIEEGNATGAFDARHPAEAAQVVVALMFSVGDIVGERFTADDLSGRARAAVERVGASFTEALERVLGARAGSLQLMDESTLDAWFGPATRPEPQPAGEEHR
jgi:AcrR family transcriptional regulator